MKKADLIVDLQYGSTGKGLMAGYMAVKNEYDVVMNANMPNAGHTFIDAVGNVMIHKVLPNGLVSPNCKFVMIGPGSVFDPYRLRDELQMVKQMGYGGFKVFVHANATILSPDHRKEEQSTLNCIASTMQGSAAATIHKMMRDPLDNPTAAAWEPHMEDVRVIDQLEWEQIIKKADSILMEGAQGFSLGINERFYPYCTSRECTPARFMSDMSMPLPYLRRVVGTARVHPIRVGSTPGGFSGDHYDDQEETSWEALGVDKETTTVTGRTRRVFTFSQSQIEDAIWACQPNEVFLNFCNYDPAGSEVIANQIIGALAETNGGRLRYTGWGPTVNDIHERCMLDPCDYEGEGIGWSNR